MGHLTTLTILALLATRGHAANPWEQDAEADAMAELMREHNTDKGTYGIT